MLFRKQLQQFRRLAEQAAPRFALSASNLYPCLDDATQDTGFDSHYVYHPAWATRCLIAIDPAEHVDIGSSLKFISILSAFYPVRYFDYRPARLHLDGLSSGHADLTKLHFPSGSIASLSCLHVVEHIGLGRYGDPLDYDGDLKAAAELTRVLADGGDLLIVVPVGRSRIEFNAHRIYSFQQVCDMFSGLVLADYALIPDNYLDTGIIAGASRTLTDAQLFGCGCFWFKQQPTGARTT